MLVNENLESKTEFEEESKKKNKNDEVAIEKTLDFSKIIASYDFFERFLIFNKGGEKVILENFDWHHFKGLKSYVTFYFYFLQNILKIKKRIALGKIIHIAL